MEANFQPRMKRKEFEDVIHDDFSDFPLSSPATKIRRLDAEHPPVVIVDEEPECAAAAFDQPPEHSCNNLGSWKIEELPNEERAIVLYSPSTSITTPIVHSPPNFSVSLHPQFMSEFKNQIARAGQANTWILDNDKDKDEDDGCPSKPENGCQAVVPWIPPRFPCGDGNILSSQTDSEAMDEEMGEATMDVEDSVDPEPTQPLPQWHHCTIAQPPHSTTTPIVWYQ